MQGSKPLYQSHPHHPSTLPNSIMLSADLTDKVIYACLTEDVDTLKAFYEQGYDLNHLHADYKDAPAPLLILAVANNLPRSFNTLMDFGLDLETVYEGLTPLHFAVRLGYVDFVKALVASGANINAIDIDEFTPLMTSLSFEYDDLTEYLLQQPQLDVNIPTNRVTPLEVFLRDEHFHFAELIMHHPSFDANYHMLLFTHAPEKHYLLEQFPDIDPDTVKAYTDTLLFGTKFDCEGCFTLSAFQEYAVDCFSFGSVDNKTMFDAITNAYDRFYYDVVLPSDIPPWGANAYQQVQDTIHFTQNTLNPSDFYARVLAGDLVIIPSGWDGHSVYIVINGDTLYRINRGMLADDPYGIDEFSIHDHAHLSIEIMEKLEQASGDPTFIQEELHALLDLSLMGKVENPLQTIGNCGWTSAETSIEAALIAAFLNQGIEINTAHMLAKESFQIWEEHDLGTSLESVIDNKDLYIAQGTYDTLLVGALQAHHDINKPGDIYRGTVIIHELSERGQFDHLSLFYNNADYADFLVACQDYETKIASSPLTLHEILHIPTPETLAVLFNAIPPNPIAHDVLFPMHLNSDQYHL